MSQMGDLGKGAGKGGGGGGSIREAGGAMGKKQAAEEEMYFKYVYVFSLLNHQQFGLTLIVNDAVSFCVLWWVVPYYLLRLTLNSSSFFFTCLSSLFV